MRAVSTLLCIGLGAGLPHAAHAGSPGAQTSDSGPIHVDIAESAGDVAMMRTWILDAASKGMADAQVAPNDTLPGREMVVQIEGVVLDYHYIVGVRTPSGWVGTTESMTCACKDQELIARIRAAVAEASPRLKGDPQAPVGPADSTVVRRPLGAKGIAGAILLGAGVGGIVGGAVLVARPDARTTRSDDRERYHGTTTKPSGIGLLVAGGVVAITGAVLLGLAVKARRKPVAWTPVVGSRFVGVSFGGKF